MNRFGNAVSAMPEVTDLYRKAGDVDYMLRVVVPGMAAYEAFYKRLAETAPFKSVTSRIAMERLKHSTAYPVPTPPNR